jgi:hypothetical protein
MALMGVAVASLGASARLSSALSRLAGQSHPHHRHLQSRCRRCSTRPSRPCRSARIRRRPGLQPIKARRSPWAASPRHPRRHRPRPHPPLVSTSIGHDTGRRCSLRPPSVHRRRRSLRRPSRPSGCGAAASRPLSRRPPRPRPSPPPARGRRQTTARQAARTPPRATTARAGAAASASRPGTTRKVAAAEKSGRVLLVGASSSRHRTSPPRRRDGASRQGSGWPMCHAFALRCNESQGSDIYVRGLGRGEGRERALGLVADGPAGRPYKAAVRSRTCKVRGWGRGGS